MRVTLEKWISDADAISLLENFNASDTTLDLSQAFERMDKYYIALVGELFDALRAKDKTPEELSRLGNAFSQFCTKNEHISRASISSRESAVFSAAAYYCGGFPASAYVSLKPFEPNETSSEESKACFDLIVKPKRLLSLIAKTIRYALLTGNNQAIKELTANQRERTKTALLANPGEWINSRTLEALLSRFANSNIRAKLPEGDSEFWNPLISSFLERSPSIWEFFPSQIEAIETGLIDSFKTFSVQMPTGAGKTALCETLLFWHAKKYPSASAVFLVPYRSLASELRGTLVKRLNNMGIPSRCAYAYTVPVADEASALDATKVIVATPESLSGLLSADTEFFNRISLVICDEGHLLDSGDRGINLELLLARFRSRDSGAPRFVFMSAIIPNIDEINAWLGGEGETVIRSGYRPAIAEYALLRPSGRGSQQKTDLIMHPHLKVPARFEIKGMLSPRDFSYCNQKTGRNKIYPHTSVKSQAVAIARKAMNLGISAIFAANKSGSAGAIGIAEEVIKQLGSKTSLPIPNDYANIAELQKVCEYVTSEYGNDWICTKAIDSSFILHHGDIPQETREAFEYLLRKQCVHLAICTNTLAEGVNLPIHTLIIYSACRRTQNGKSVNMLTRDIKNLVGRAGRPGANTHGLVICANQNDWPLIHRVTAQVTEEPVYGALYKLIIHLYKYLASNNAGLSNDLLEGSEHFQALIDSIDSILVDLAVEEIGASRFEELAKSVVKNTFAFRRIDDESKGVLEKTFLLRAQKLTSLISAGQLDWVKATGVKVRLVDTVEKRLLPLIDDWTQVSYPLQGRELNALLAWVFDLKEVQSALATATRAESAFSEITKEQMTVLIKSWLAGDRWKKAASLAKLDMGDALRVYTGVISYSMQTNIEQGITILANLLQQRGLTLSTAFLDFPKQLRFGTQSLAGCALAESGMRHRSAYATLGRLIDEEHRDGFEPSFLAHKAYSFLTSPDQQSLKEALGSFVYDRSIKDVISKLNKLE